VSLSVSRPSDDPLLITCLSSKAPLSEISLKKSYEDEMITGVAHCVSNAPLGVDF